MIKATSATVRNLTSLKGVSLAIQFPLPHDAEHLTGFSAPVTYASRVSPVRKSAKPHYCYCLDASARTRVRAMLVSLAMHAVSSIFANGQLTSAACVKSGIGNNCHRPVRAIFAIAV